VAKTLVVTALGCVMRPSEWIDPNPAADPTFGNPPPLQSFGAAAPYAEACLREGTWTATEDGSLMGMLGQALEPSALTVFRVGGQKRIPSKIVTSHAASRCADGLALLVLDEELDVQPVPVRLDDATRATEAVTLNGYCRSSPVETLSEVNSEIEAITWAAGTDMLPPRSLWLSGGLSTLEVGGAVASSQTGAIIGIITSASAASCAGRDPAGNTIGLQLAPFRRMLLDTAFDANVELRIERVLEPMTRVRVDCAGSAAGSKPDPG
jgi:hypothetical protein